MNKNTKFIISRFNFRVVVAAFLPLFFFLSIFSHHAKAQVNTEKYRASANGDRFGGNLDLSFSWYTGNTEIISADTELGLYYNRGKNQFFLRGILKYVEKDKESFVNMGFLHLRGIRKFGERVMAEAFVQKEFNKFILLNSRDLGSAGMRFMILKSESGKAEKKKLFVLYFGAGLMWEEETFSPAEDGSLKEDTSFLKSTNYFSLSYNTGALEFGLVSYFQFHLKELAAFRNFSDCHIKFKLSSYLNFVSKINFRFDNRPPATIKKYDIHITNGLSVEF